MDVIITSAEPNNVTITCDKPNIIYVVGAQPVNVTISFNIPNQLTSQSLKQTLIIGNNTDGKNIIINNDDAIQLENGSSIRKGTYDFGANGGVSRICGVGFEDMWQGGIRHIFDNNGLIRNSTNCFDIIPDVNFDITLRFKVGSIWTLDDGTSYICTDATVGAAVWELYNAIPTNTSDLTNDGEDGVNPFITAADVPSQVNSDWDATSGVAEILNKPTIPTNTSDLTNDSGFITAAEVPTVNDATASVKGILKLTNDLGGTADLPTVPALSNKVDKVTGKGLSTNDFTDTLKTKLDGIADGAEVNVNADWNATSGDAQILNKPTLATVATSGSYTDLTNKPTIPAAQIQSDWNQSNNVSLDFIKNKPTIPSISNLVPYTGANADVNLGIKNLYSNNYFDGFSSIVASGTLVTLTINSVPTYVITGSGGQTIKLPDATTLPNGAIYYFNNNQSSGAISINNNSNTLVASVPSGGFTQITLLSNSIAAGSWERHEQAPSNVSWSTNTFDYPGSITSATWNGVSIADNRIASAATWNAKQNASTRRNANNSSNNNINYCGVALGTGVSESSAVWTIKRLTIAASGSITTATATNVAWTNRESATYI